MSADNGIYILQTTDKFKQVDADTYKNVSENGVTAYRVAEAFAIDNYEFYKESEPHNLGYWMYSVFGKSEVYYDYEEACEKAEEFADWIQYTEYGINNIDASEYCFPF